MFALHYAHAYYAAACHGRPVGLRFPDDDHPEYGPYVIQGGQALMISEQRCEAAGQVTLPVFDNFRRPASGGDGLRCSKTRSRSGFLQL